MEFHPKHAAMQGEEPKRRQCSVHDAEDGDEAMAPAGRRRAKKKGLAATYSPAFPQYHRRESA